MASKLHTAESSRSTVTPKVCTYYLVAAPTIRTGSFKNPLTTSATGRMYTTGIRSQATDSVLRSQFDGLAERWEEETAHLSSLSRRRDHAYFARLTKLGPRAIPWALERMKGGNPFWFLVLKQIAPGGPTERSNGNMEKVRERWLEWGKDHGHVS